MELSVKMYPIWNCPIRRRILTETLVAVEDPERLRVMAFLKLFRVKVKADIIDELCQSDYPLPVIKQIFECPDKQITQPLLDTLHIRRCLPRLRLASAAVIVSGLGATPPRNAHPYWIDCWNRTWKEFGTFNDLSKRTQEALCNIAGQVSGHRSVDDVFIKEHSLPNSDCLEPIDWIWERELQTLPLRGILALVLRGIWRTLTSNSSVSKMVEEVLADAVAFVQGAECLSICGFEFENGDWIKSQYAEPRDVLDLLTATLDAVEATLCCANSVSRYISHRDSGELEFALSSGGRAARFFASTEDFTKLLALDLGKFPEIGRPVDLTERGPLGALVRKG